MLKKRIITAAILIPVMLAAVFYLPPGGFLYFTGAIVLGAAWEWSNLMGVKQFGSRVMYVFLMLFMLFGALFVPIPFILFCSLLSWIFYTTLIALYPRASAWWGKSYFWRGLMGLFVLVPCWGAINFIRNQSDGLYALLFLFVLIWGADSVAYFVGKKWGKTKLAPLVSPGKSVQGAIGAISFAIVLAIVMFCFEKGALSACPWAISLAVTTVIFSIIGDLFESMLKRQEGLKDSGSLLPGHGGLLDRIDSLTAAAPVYALGAWLLGIYLNT